VIPSFNHSGVLPPFLPGEEPTKSAAMAPYRASITEIAQEFARTPERTRILTGLLDFREIMREVGIDVGFQWVAGSFMEDCEGNRGRPPRDVDVVTFARRPAQHIQQNEWSQFVTTNQAIFSPSAVKRAHNCDAFYVDLMLPPELVVSRSRYWFGLFSHQRSTHLWKGIVEVPLVDDDDQARAILARGVPDAT
jgi:hypothetical protein